MAGNLQRKMSMRDDDEVALTRKASAQPQNELIAKQKDITNEFKLLT